MRLLRAGERIATSWKNGGGITEEVVVDPPGASLSDFNWRISIAQVRSSGPFSSFSGVDRVLAVLSGGPITLHVEGRAPEMLTETTLPLAFSGEAPTRAELIGRDLTDLNLMFRRGRYYGAMKRQTLAAPLSIETSGAVILLLALDPVTTAAGPLQPLDAIMFDPGDTVFAEPDRAPARIVLVTVEAV